MKKSHTFQMILFFCLILFSTVLTNLLMKNVESITAKKLLEDGLALAWIPAGVANVLATVVLLFLSRRVNIIKIIEYVFIFTGSMIALFFLCIIPFNDVFMLGDSAVSVMGQYLPSAVIPYVMDWSLIVFSSLTILWPPAMVLLFYGYANEVFSFRVAVRYYPFFGVLAVVLNEFIVSSVCCMLGVKSSFNISFVDFPWMYYGMILLVLLGAAFAIFEYLHRILPYRDVSPQENKSADPFGWKYVMLLGTLLGLSGVILVISKAMWKYHIQVQFPSPSDYAHYLGSFDSYVTIATLMTFTGFLFMSCSLRERLVKAWKNYYYALSCVSFILGGGFFIFTVYGDALAPLINSSVGVSAKPISSLTTIGSSYQLLILSVIYPLILCLKELAIVPLPSNYRFTVKLIIDLIFIKGSMALGMVILQGASSLFGTLQEAFVYIAFLFFVICFFRFLLIYIVGNRLERGVASELN